MHNSFCWQGSTTYIGSDHMYKYMSLSWYFLIYMNSDCFRFRFQGSWFFFLGSGFFAEANSTLVAGCGSVGLRGLWGGGPGWWRHKLITELWGLDRSNRILPQSKSFPVWPWGFMVWRCQSSATKLKLLQRLGFGDVAVAILREILWGFNWNHLGSEVWGELKSWYLWMMYRFPAFWSWLQNPVDSSEVLVKWATSNTC